MLIVPGRSAIWATVVMRTSRRETGTTIYTYGQVSSDEQFELGMLKNISKQIASVATERRSGET